MPENSIQIVDGVDALKQRHLYTHYELVLLNMALVHSVTIISALLGVAKTKIANDTWPGCGDKIARHDQRDWSAWYKWYKNKSMPDIKVHVYRHPPFNWLHPVSNKCTLNPTLTISITITAIHRLIGCIRPVINVP